ncbi:hypothetical protein ZTR_01133 [Talaromyces verruculosus]|nr:hypothetical protein ZTR_01133 [Talaromyces verruculosus]
MSTTIGNFSAVIQELNSELLVPVVLFYLVLRGLDTIEDDMALPLDRKVPLLRNFYNIMKIDGWQFHESREKDRELLENFDVVITELKKLKPEYYAVIEEMTIKMGNGMADYAQNDELIQNGVQTVEDYELYCHYVAGLVGEGLTKLFLLSGYGDPKLAELPTLTESMGQLLQKNNIIRDVREDWEEGRRWYPRDIWIKHVDKWDDLFDNKYEEKALNCVSEMVLNGLKHCEDCLFYMSNIREQSVFNFVAIPECMGIATLEVVFRNPDVIKRNVKITRGDACHIMIDCQQNMHGVYKVFRRYIRKIRMKNDPKDPSYLDISSRCEKIEEYIEAKENMKELTMKATQRQKYLSIILLCLGAAIVALWLNLYPRIFEDAGGRFQKLITANIVAIGRDEL